MKVRFEPFGAEVEAQAGDRLLDLALEAGVHINASCGGEGVCGKCRVHLESGNVEGGLSEKVSAAEAEAGVRLACQSIISGRCGGAHTGGFGHGQGRSHRSGQRARPK